MNARFDFMRKETRQVSRAGLTFGDEDCGHKSFFAHVSMSSLTWSLGRYNVSLVFPCAIRSSSHSSSSQSSSRRTLSCDCALPAFSSSDISHNLLPPSVPTRAPEPQTEPSKSHDSLESGHSNSERSSTHGDCFQQQRLLQSVLSVVVAFVMTIGVQGAPSSRETFEDVPQTLSVSGKKISQTSQKNAVPVLLKNVIAWIPKAGEDKGHRIQKPNSAKAETCTRKCVSTCIRGGAGAPGEGPLNVRRPLVVFKEGFRSRNYCLVECSEICNIIGDGDDGP